MQIMKYKKVYIHITLLVMLTSILLLIIFGLKLSIDFTGGSILKYELDMTTQSTEIESLTTNIFNSNGVLIENMGFDEGIFVVRTKPIDAATSDTLNKAMLDAGIAKSVSFESIGSVLGYETLYKSAMALLISFFAILFYIAYAFRNIPKPYSSIKFGASALFAMVHDVLIVLGIFAILGHFFDVEVDILFVTALLTLIGFSVNDTIVVFDRIRENLLKKKRETFEEITNASIRETLRRSLSTAFTVLVVLVSLFLLGGDNIRFFVLALIIGISTGAYSSIFVASPILVYWESHKGK